MHLSLYVYLNFPLLGIIPIILCNKAQPAKTWSAGSVTGRALRHDRRGQNASEVVELAGKSYGKLPCLLNTDNGTEEGLWWVKLHIGFFIRYFSKMTYLFGQIYRWMQFVLLHELGQLSLNFTCMFAQVWRISRVFEWYCILTIRLY